MIGALPLLIALPVAILFFKDKPPPKVADPLANLADTAPVAAPDGLRAPEALRGWPFWAIFIAFVPIAAGIAGPIPNMENLLKSKAFTLEAITHQDIANHIGASREMVSRLLKDLEKGF